MDAKQISDIAEQYFLGLSHKTTPGAALDYTAHFLSTLYPDVEVYLYKRGVRGLVTASAGTEESKHYDFEIQREKILLDGEALELPQCIFDVSTVYPQTKYSRALDNDRIRFAVALALQSSKSNAGLIELRSSTREHIFDRTHLDLLRHLSLLLSVFLERTEESSWEQLDEIRLQYMRLVEYGNLVIVRTDKDFKLQSVLGDTRSIAGISPEEMIRDDFGEWLSLLNRADLEVLKSRILDAERRPQEFDGEIRVVHQGTGELHTLLVRAIPIYSKERKLVGWEGFGVDVTAEKQAQSELIAQRGRMEALFEVSRSLRFNMDPALVALRGLRSLIKATESSSGLAFFYSEESKRLELVAAEGVSERYLNDVQTISDRRNLVRYVIETKTGLSIEDIQEDPRAATEMARKEGLHSTIVMPLRIGNTVLGAVVLFRRNVKSYTDADFNLVNAAASQISLVARQAEYYSHQKEQASSFAALYQLSHDLSGYFSVPEIASHAFTIVNEQVQCRNMWLGIVNEQRTAILGQAGYGESVHGDAADLKLDITRQNDFLDEALATGKPVVVRSGEGRNCKAINQLVKQFRLGTFVILPLVALGRTVGVLVLEPAVPSMFFAQRKLPLLSRMGSEIATVIVTRKLESQIADTEKMRMASVISGGVAHNFNNLLQTIMGQTSLLALQVSDDPVLQDSTKTILDAASRGASIIKQLMSLSQSGVREKESVNIADVLEDSREFYRSILGPDILFDFQAGDKLPLTYVDVAQIQQVITNIIMNARDAVRQRFNARVAVRCSMEKISDLMVSNLAPGDYIAIEIEDNGEGMTSDLQARCFEPFYTTKNIDDATGIGVKVSGLGLASAYSIIRQHQGHIAVQSVEGEGTLFTLYLPISAEGARGFSDAAENSTPVNAVVGQN